MSFLSRLGQNLIDFFGERTPLDELADTKERSFDLLDPDYFADLLFYRLYDEENKIYENKTSFGFVIEVAPLLGAGQTESQELSSLMKDLGSGGSTRSVSTNPGCCIQALCFADHRIEPFLSAWSNARLGKGSIFEEISLKKESFFLETLQQSRIPPRIFRFIFSYTEPKRGDVNLSHVMDRLVKKKVKALEVLNRISGKNAFEIDPLRLMELVSGLVNYEKKPRLDCRRNWNRHTWLSKQICNPGTAIRVLENGILFHGAQPSQNQLPRNTVFGNDHKTGCSNASRSNASNSDTASNSIFDRKTLKIQDRDANHLSLLKTYEVVDYPSEWALSYMGDLLGDFFNASYRIPSPFYLHYGIHFPSQSKVEAKFRSKAKIVDHQIKFPSLTKIFPDMPREHEEHLFVHKELIEGEMFVETRLSVGLWAHPETHVSSESNLIALFQKYGFKLKDNHFMHLPDFLSSLPMAWGEDAKTIKNLKRTRCFRTTLTSETGSLMPILGEWWGNSTKGMILMGRRGQIASWDPFATEGNFNTVVVGPSGSGKSVFMQDLLLNHLRQGDRVFILDLGRSFEKLCHLLKGQHLAFSVKSRLNLNPFSVIKATPEALDVGLEMVAGILATMAMPAHQIDKERSDLLSAVAKQAWGRKGQDATVDTVIDLLKEKQFQSELMTGSSESLQEGLKKFSQQGPYSNYFYGSQQINLTHHLVVIETEELKSMADLQAVILQIFIMTISNQIFMGDREQRSLICIDEAWDLLKSPQMEGFIESLARRLRKYNGALIIGTQSVKDFERSYGAKAAAQNSNWLCMLGKDNDSIQAIKKDNILTLDPFKEQTLASLRMEEGKYSEVFIHNKGSGFFSVNQLKLDPFSSMLYSTQADEFQAVQALQKRGLSPEGAINWLVTHKLKFKTYLSQGKKVKEILSLLLTLTDS